MPRENLSKPLPRQIALISAAWPSNKQQPTTTVRNFPSLTSLTSATSQDFRNIDGSNIV